MSDTFVIGSSGVAVITKDPQAVLDYIFDWTAYLAAISDTLVSVSFTASSGTITDFYFLGPIATAWISGGVVGTSITLTCHIVTAGGRTDERHVSLRIKER